MKKYDLLIKNALVYPLQKIRDIAIKDGKIVELKQNIEVGFAETVIDAKNKLVTPGFVDAQLHIDKAYLSDEDETTDATSACIRTWNIISEKYNQWNEEDIIEEIVERGSRVIENCIRNGTVALKNNVTINESWGLISLKAIKVLKEKYKNKITIKNVVPYDEYFDKQWRDAAKANEIDFVGGYANITVNPKTSLPEYVNENYAYIDKLFDLAKEYSLPLDIFCDESSETSINTFSYIITKTLENKKWANVTCSCVASLSKMSQDEALAAIALSAKSGTHIITMTSCDLNLGDISRRSTTTVKDFMHAGVNISTASGNVRDAFRPFGNCDLIEEALITAQCHKYDTSRDMERLMRMITFNPAQNLMIDNYGVLPDSFADLVILDATSPGDAIISQAKKEYVIYHGEIVAQQNKFLSK